MMQNRRDYFVLAMALTFVVTCGDQIWKKFSEPQTPFSVALGVFELAVLTVLVLVAIPASTVRCLKCKKPIRIKEPMVVVGMGSSGAMHVACHQEGP